MVSTAYGEQRQLVTVSEARQMDGEGIHRIVIAANERSRNGDELNLRGVAFKNYLKNPVVLWAHDRFGGIPIGKTLEIDHDDQGKIVVDFQFNSDDEFAARVENAWNGGFIRAASIRYLPTKVVEVRGNGGEVERLRVEESELLEWSLVPIPADPDSVRAAARELNLPEEIFRGFETTPYEDSPQTGVNQEGVPSQLRTPLAVTTASIDQLVERVEALEKKVFPPSTEEHEHEPQETTGPDVFRDPVLEAVGSELAVIMQMIGEK